jgi:acyl phosphate:glycerol-3-phosphate acyltransferase
MHLPPALIAAAYLLGSIPFSFLVVRLMSGRDIREEGSRNVGATNVARTAGKAAGVIALLLDIAKGYAAVVLGRWVVGQHGWPFEAGAAAWESREFWVALAGLIAVLGHMFPIWLRFHGGKGVATAAGVFLALNPLVLAAAMLVFLIVALAFRMISLASIITAASIPVLMTYLGRGAPFWHVVVSIAIALVVIAKHHENISRIAGGKERRLGQKKDQR